MSEIIELTKINFSYVFISVFAILIAIRAIVSLFEWIFEKFGIETKWMRTRREEYELLIQTSKDLNDFKKEHINDMHKSDECDAAILNDIAEIRHDIKALTNMFTNSEIDKMRWEINDFANKISDGMRCNKDSYKHILRTYNKYEEILKENGLENGEVEISMELINDAYKQKLKEGF